MPYSLEGGGGGKKREMGEQEEWWALHTTAQVQLESEGDIRIIRGDSDDDVGEHRVAR